ncbi:putative FmdB family regulatory protein [Stackebrandtia endophytica]|uniref:Putative FmdB family regulatory protein n=1 Tax=Stackebrandtia endophytica TaxID=1496996 RepID=A0A543AQX3_9ACTN|nr:zinc ribbon domain-containing protein [Stackebrandtia endophytica]TQL74964.1 putative FmdB family regulatory protein [Stackebrandtia endophytica]
MPRYDYRCRTCDSTFEASRPMSQANDPATCPNGHENSVKLLTTVGLAGAVSSSAPAGEPAGGGGCCGGGCCG